MAKSLCSSLITWLRTFPGHGTLTLAKLSDGVALGAILHEIAPEYFTDQWLSKIRTDVVDNWRLKVSNLKKIYQGLMDFFYHTELPVHALQQFPAPDVNKIVELHDETEFGRLLQLILGCAINCELKQKHIEGIMKLEESVQTLIVNAIQELMNAENAPGSPETPGMASSGAWAGPASFNPQLKGLMEQLEALSIEKEKMTRRCNELDLQISIMVEEKRNLKDENEKLKDRVDIFEAGEDVGGQSFRNKDLRKQIETLQDELFKVESSRDEYRSRVEGIEKENKELTIRSEELQALADEARSLKDEVDALRDMSERVAVYEGTVETYKKKLEELSDLKRQVKILEEKNSGYMQQNMELEEEVKKSVTWRPQLDLYKKQVGELHQKLADEAKKTDRQVFENKKIMDKLEALTQEKERVLLERDVLKESVEELKCTVSALNTPDAASRSPNDLGDIDTLEIIPPEIREKLVRLQHENRVLKQRVSDKSDESSSVLQSILNDLQERHDKLLHENRWAKACPPLLPFRPQSPPFNRIWPLDKHLTIDTTRVSNPVKVLRRNLKSASESDLLILRQPSPSPLPAFLASFLPPKVQSNFSPVNSLTHSEAGPLPSRPSSKENPIVIRHIHEFKMSSSPTNEDSGCCRTSPSSCEGFDDRRSFSYGTRTPDYAGTLDSGVSGMFRSLSPVIPSIVEECTANHVSDILPAIMNQDSPPFCQSYPRNGESRSCCCNACVLSSKLNECIENSSNRRDTNDVASHGHHPVFSPSTSISTTCSNIKPQRHSITNYDHSLSSDVDLPNNTQESDTSETYPINKQPLPQRPQPPGSPTPHNSPKLPHSINSMRSKVVKQPLCQSLADKSVRFEAGASSASGKSLVCDVRKPVHRDSLNRDEKIKGVSAIPNGKVIQKNRHICSSKTVNVGYLETDLDEPLPLRTRSNFVDNVSNASKDGRVKSNRSKSLDKSVLCNKSISRTATNFEDPQLKKTDSPKISLHCSQNPKLEIRREKLRYVGCVEDAVPSRSPALDKKKSRKSSLQGNKTYDELKYDFPHIYVGGSLENESGRLLEKDCAKKKLIKPKISSSEITLLANTLNSQFVAAPRRNLSFEALSATDKIQKSMESTKPKSSSLSLNCFPIPCRHRNHEPVSTDTDTDIELVENRLMSSAFGAPIVTPESSISLHHSDSATTDIDPSATDYCTEPELDFNPLQYKVQSLPLCKQPLIKRNDFEDAVDRSLYPIVRPTSYFQRKKTQLFLASKKKLRTGGVIKIKNKTTRALAAETFNAMFLLCTP